MTGFDPQRDELVGQACLSFQAQFSLPASARHALAELSRQIQGLVRSRLWIAPAESLHVTCHSLISPRDAFDGKEPCWDRMSARATEAVRRIEAEVPSFVIRFRAVRATDRAIIVLAGAEPSVTSARAIFSRLVAPQETRPVLHYDTIHTTICRYIDPAGLPAELPQIVAGLRVDIRAEIDRLVLLRETVYPSLQTETLLAVSLTPAD